MVWHFPGQTEQTLHFSKQFVTSDRCYVILFKKLLSDLHIYTHLPSTQQKVFFSFSSMLSFRDLFQLKTCLLIIFDDEELPSSPAKMCSLTRLDLF